MVSGRLPRPEFSMLWCQPPYCTVLERGLERSNKPSRLESAQYRLAHYMLGAKPMDHVRMTRAYEELGMIPLKVLLVRRNLAWAARIINYNESRLPWVVMHNQMACGRRRRGHPHQRWPETLKAALAFADLPTYREWSLSIAGIGDN